LLLLAAMHLQNFKEVGVEEELPKPKLDEPAPAVSAPKILPQAIFSYQNSLVVKASAFSLHRTSHHIC
jgi:hypothetical protein